jgi:dynein heavy chain
MIIADDMHMPKADEGGAQPPLELLRLWLDYQGWNDWKYADFIHTENI